VARLGKKTDDQRSGMYGIARRFIKEKQRQNFPEYGWGTRDVKGQTARRPTPLERTVSLFYSTTKGGEAT